MVSDGPIKEKGVLAPVIWEMAKPLLVELKEKWGIKLVEKTLVQGSPCHDDRNDVSNVRT